MFSYFRTVSRVRSALIFINYMIIMVYAGVFLMGTRYLVVHQESLAFLSQLPHIPKDPQIVFIGCFVLYILFAILLLNSKQNQIFHFIDLIIEWVISFAIILLLDLSTQSIVLLVICDCLYHVRDLKNSQIYCMLTFSIVLYMFSNYSIMSQIIALNNLQSYFTVFSPTVNALLSSVRTILEGLNLLLFILFIAYFTVNQYKEKENIAQELEMVNEVNAQLRHYAAITEQAAENNERKRIAREIHDTLGHALTGIAAGIDACLIMIDKKPELVKGQLQRIRNVVTEGIGDVRNSLQKLRPGALEQQSLEGALKNMIQEFVSVSNVDIVLSYKLPELDFEKTKEDALFRMIQECITNSIRHGHAKHVAVRIETDQNIPDHIIVVVQDDGQGCETIHPGYGLMQMAERISTIHGTLSYEGKDGFVCKAIIPLQKGELK